jgi:membrane protease YdiL (CAAX protease family)
MAVNPIKRVLLLGITVLVAFYLGLSLLRSLAEPQVSDRLQLYQTDLGLRTVELASNGETANWQDLRRTLVGEKPLESALKEYQTVRESAQTNLNKLKARLAASADSTTPNPEAANPETPLQSAIEQQQKLLNQLDLRIGLLQVQQNQVSSALTTWRQLITRVEANPPKPIASAIDDSSDSGPSIAETANILIALWEEPPKLLPNPERTERTLREGLDGWFRFTALNRLYTLQQRPDAIAELQSAEQQTAQSTLVKLALVGLVPSVAGLMGIGVLLTWLGRLLFRRTSIVAIPNSATAPEPPIWTVPWGWDTILQVLVVGFFFVGQFILPMLLNSLGFRFEAFSNQAKAIYTLAYYLLMSGSGLLVLYLSVRPFFPLPENWFNLTGKRNWLAWGWGGFFAALPLVFLVQVINQQIWQGQGGSNPLLQTVLEEGDAFALVIFFMTAAIAAPVFEEIMFRGFLLPSLTRYFPVWGAIALSSVIFALAHLSLSEVLPLTALGSVLGVVYVRSRGLFASMLLHSLWNSMTMIGLLILGTGVK